MGPGAEAGTTWVSSLRAKRSNPGAASKTGLLRRFAPRNDEGETHPCLLATSFARVFANSFRPKSERAQGRPGARCTRGPVCKQARENAHEHTGSAETLRPSPRNGFTAYVRSPRRRIRLVTVIGGLATRPCPVGPTCLRKFSTSNGCQDHTVLPYALASLVWRDDDRSREARPATAFHTRRCRVHRIPSQRS